MLIAVALVLQGCAMSQGMDLLDQLLHKVSQASGLQGKKFDSVVKLGCNRP
jgi:hypothetical protein